MPPVDPHEAARPVDRALERVTVVLFIATAAAILTAAVAMLQTMSRAPGDLGIRLFVAVAATLSLGAADAQLDTMLRRRDLFSEGDSTNFRRYRYLSLALLTLAGIALCALAWLPTRAAC